MSLSHAAVLGFLAFLLVLFGLWLASLVFSVVPLWPVPVTAFAGGFLFVVWRGWFATPTPSQE